MLYRQVKLYMTMKSTFRVSAGLKINYPHTLEAELSFNYYPIVGMGMRKIKLNFN